MSGTYTPVQGLILLAYNAYYNRFLKFENTLQDYLDKSEGSDYLIQKVNFNPADGLNTIHIAGNGELDNRLEFRDYSFTYALLIEYNPANETREEIYADEDTHILSKWFILDNDRTRGGQYKLTLRRDVLVDYMKQIKKSPIFVEKGIIEDLENPLLLNNEDLRVNQIKSDEILLKDQTKCPWLVMYLKKGALGNNAIGVGGKITLNIPQDDTFVYQTLNVPITSWGYYQYITNDYKVSVYDVFAVKWALVAPFDVYYSKFKFWDNSNNYGKENLYSDFSNLETENTDATQRLIDNYLPSSSSLRTLALSAFGYNNANSNPLLAYNDKIIKDSQGKYFKVKVFKRNSGETNYKITNTSAPSLKIAMNNIWNTAQETSITADNNAFEVKINWEGWGIALEELTNIDTTIDFSAYTGSGTKDSMLFDVIALPYGDVRISNPSEFLYGIHTSAERSLLIMSSIATQLTSQWVLDLQLLPYCPVQSLINSEASIVFTNNTNETGLPASRSTGDGTEYTDMLFVCPNMNFTLDINESIEIPNFYDVPPAFHTKFLNDCTMIRICSPNYNGLFEMNLAKNGGSINKFNVDITMRPFNPYIHVNPDFNLLYGSDFDDIRGLVCSGDFSLGIINDAWNVYEIQNKNYQAIFDRQIQNLDINNSIQMQEATWGALAGTVSGAASGAAGGAIAGGGWGALAGAVIGGVTSGVGGALDISNLQKRQQENRSYAIDNYNFQLGNVRALPNSITKTSALTYNNKLFPFVEIYRCTAKEEEAYFNKLYWNGMTIGIIDYLPNYESGNWANYFRGKLIALYGEEGSNAVENRIIEAINTELMKGVFI